MENSLTVIIPNYNKAKYLEECIESVEKQSFLPNEIIIIDDCSTDDSRNIIKNLSSKYNNLKYIFLDSNSGVSAARNKGIDCSTSKYITFLDSDDKYINPDKLSNEMKIVTRGKNIVSYSVTITIDEKSNIIDNKYNRKWKNKEFVKGDSFVELVSFIKQSRVPRDYCLEKNLLLNVGGYSYEKNFYEDLDLVFRLAESKADFECTYEQGTGYRQLAGGLSSRTTTEHRKARKAIAKHYFKKMGFKKKLLCRLYQLIAFFSKLGRDLSFFINKRILKNK